MWCDVRSWSNPFFGSLLILVALPILSDGNRARGGYIPCASLHQTPKSLLPSDSSLVSTAADAQVFTTLLVDLRLTGEGCGLGPQGVAENQPGNESPAKRAPSDSGFQPPRC